MVKFFEIITAKLSFGFKIQSGLINLYQPQKKALIRKESGLFVNK
jgi:hypothetical protein